MRAFEWYCCLQEARSEDGVDFAFAAETGVEGEDDGRGPDDED